MEYSAPPERVVFDVRAASHPERKRSDPSYVTGTSFGTPVVAYAPQPWVRLETLLSGSAPTWPSFTHWAVPAFMHRRVSAAGHERLVVVQLDAVWDDGGDASLSADVLQPGSFTRDPRAVSAPSQVLYLYQRYHGGNARDFALFAGQPDTTDASHLTIECEFDHARHLVDGWLQDDDTVKLELRPDPPVTPPPPPSPASPR